MGSRWPWFKGVEEGTPERKRDDAVMKQRTARLKRE